MAIREAIPPVFKEMQNTRRFHRLTIVVPADLMEELIDIRAQHRVSISAIVEHFLLKLLDGDHRASVIDALVCGGASLRRKRRPRS